MANELLFLSSPFHKHLGFDPNQTNHNLTVVRKVSFCFVQGTRGLAPGFAAQYILLIVHPFPPMQLTVLSDVYNHTVVAPCHLEVTIAALALFGASRKRHSRASYNQ